MVTRRGVTLDTGGLMALERKDKRMRDLIASARAAGVSVMVPAPVIIEWWRAGPGQRAVLERLTVEPLSERVAKAAGEAIAQLPIATAVDAAVMASAALRGDVVYTSDMPDLERLQAVFPGVLLMRA